MSARNPGMISPDLLPPYLAGRFARQHGQGLGDCPYPRGHREGVAWALGFLDEGEARARGCGVEVLAQDLSGQPIATIQGGKARGAP
jgi:hypothetical protein